MSTDKNIEHKLYTPEQLEKLELLRRKRDLENDNRKDQIKYESKRWIPKNGDKVDSHVLTYKLETKRGIILSVKRDKKKGGLKCDVQFGMFVFEGVPSRHLGHSPTKDPGETDWTGRLDLFTKVHEYSQMPTKKLLAIFKKERFSKDADIIKRILNTQEHVPKKSEKNMKAIKHIKWEDFEKERLQAGFWI